MDEGGLGRIHILVLVDEDHGPGGHHGVLADVFSVLEDGPFVVEPRAHRLVLEAVEGLKKERLRGEYVERVARVDLDPEAVPTLAR